MHERVFQSVKRACYAGLGSVALRQTVAERIRPAVTFDAYAFGTADPETGLLDHQVAANVPLTMARAYAEYLYPIESAPQLAARVRTRRAVVRAGEESEAVMAVQRAHGFRHGTHVVFTHRERIWGQWCLFRERASDRRVSDEHRFLQRLVPHLTQGLQRAALRDAAVEGTSATGVIVMTAAGRLVVRTPAASRILEDIADVGVTADDRVPLSIRSCAARALRNASDAPMHARGRSGCLYKIDSDVAEPDADGQTRIVITIRAESSAERAGRFLDLYGLSPRERQIIAAVARGETTREIALGLGISPYTVQEHVDRACDKIGARGRRELIGKLFMGAARAETNTVRRS